MPLTISLGQFSDKGRKPINQDFHGALIPDEPLLSLKGVAVALADGISSSEVSHIASESAVKSFLTDYYCTPDTWSVKTSAQRVIVAINSWLHAQTRRGQRPGDGDRGYVCTLSVMVMRAATAHLFHIGDARIVRVTEQAVEQLTEDHRIVVSSAQSYLARALGVRQQIEIDYRELPLQAGDVFMLATDGAYEHVSTQVIIQTVRQCNDLDAAARSIGEEAARRGSADNITVQLVRIDALPDIDARDLISQAEADLPLPPILDARMEFDGYRIVRKIHDSSRSHLYLAIDGEDGAKVALKTPSIDLGGDRAYLQRLRLEEWVARRINSPHVLRPHVPSRPRKYVYVASEFVEGQTLRQWIIDNPAPPLETVRTIVEQIAKGLQAFHRLEMLHQDLRPDNIMIDREGTAKIIDFGSTHIAGVSDDAAFEILGTAQYTAPEYFRGEAGSTHSDIFSLGVIAYEMLTGRLPYGAAVARTRTRVQQRKLQYRSALDDNRDIPPWVDGALGKAVHWDRAARYDELSEFLFDLRHPNRAFLDGTRVPLMDRAPLMVWQFVSATLFIVVLILLFLLTRRP